jgi:hypothetical protein
MKILAIHSPPVANVIIDGSSPFTRSLPTADSKCQPLFILRTGRELGQLWLVSGVWSFCQFLTANTYPGLEFGTISGTEFGTGNDWFFSWIGSSIDEARVDGSKCSTSCLRAISLVIDDWILAL